MRLDPHRLIDRSIADLTQLSAVLAAELRDEPLPRSAELRTCEEVVATITDLLPRLQATRNVRIAVTTTGPCPGCED